MIIYFIGGMLVIFLLWHLLYRRFWKKGVSVQIDFEEENVYAGESATLIEVIENRKRIPIPVLEVAFHTRKELVFVGMENTNVSDFAYKRDVFALLGYQRITRKLSLECTKRGHYSIEEADAISFSLFFKERYSITQPVSARLYVFPKKVDISNIMLTCEQMMGARQCERKLFEDPFAFHSIREYTQTDPMKTINWKASAKTGGLMVNTFESTLTEKVMIYLDIEDGGILKYDDLVEDSISVAASLIRKLLHMGIQVGIAFQDTFVEPSNGKEIGKHMERLLADVDVTSSNTPLTSLLSHPSEGAFVIVISKNLPASPDAFQAIQNDRRDGICVIPYQRGNQPENLSNISSSGCHFAMLKREV